MAALRSAHPETVARDEQRSEKRKALNVIPMSVTEEDSGLHQVRHVFHPVRSEKARAGTAVEDKPAAGLRLHLDAGGVAAKPVGANTGRGDRSPSTPKSYSH